MSSSESTPTKLVLTCPGCSKRFQLPNGKLLGKRATCKACGAGFMMDGSVVAEIATKDIPPPKQQPWPERSEFEVSKETVSVPMVSSDEKMPSKVEPLPNNRLNRLGWAATALIALGVAALWIAVMAMPRSSQPSKAPEPAKNPEPQIVVATKDNANRVLMELYVEDRREKIPSVFVKNDGIELEFDNRFFMGVWYEFSCEFPESISSAAMGKIFEDTWNRKRLAVFSGMDLHGTAIQLLEKAEQRGGPVEIDIADDRWNVTLHAVRLNGRREIWLRINRIPES